MSDNMKNFRNKPSLNDLLISKKLSNPLPDSWADFDEKVKIRALESYHKDSSNFFPKKFFYLTCLLVFSFFGFQQIYLSSVNDFKYIKLSTVDQTASSSQSSDNFEKLSNDLTNSEIEFVNNSYLTILEDDFDMSFSLQNMDISENDSTFVAPVFVFEDNSIPASPLSNFTF